MDEKDNIAKYKSHPRDPELQKSLNNRLNRVIGQLNGVSKMILDNRYCGDVLIQIAAAESALQEIGYIILKNHMDTCVAEEVQKGNTKSLDELMELIRKLK